MKAIIDMIENIDNYNIKLKYPKRPDGYNNENYVYDENKTVKWNREHRLELIEKYKKEQNIYNEEKNNIEHKFKSDLVELIKNEYNFSYAQSNIIFSKAWEQGHSDGLISVINEARYLSDILYEMLNAE